MSTFVLDLWHDLREKRLWPVAVLLAVGIVAIPLLMLKGGDSGSDGSPDAPGPAASAPGAGTTVELASGAVRSNLNNFKSKDPFRSTEKAKTAGGAPTGTGNGGGLDKPFSLGPGSTPAGTPSSTAPAGGAPGTGQPNAQTQVPKRVTRYTYLADVTFSRDRESRRVQDMKRLRMLPDSRTPLLLFLGVAEGGNSAAFLVDSSLTAAGEGTCRPSGKHCNVVYIGPGAEHEFVDPEGTYYLLRVNEIRKVELTRAKAASSSKHRVKARKSARRDLHTPNLVDVETVESGGSSSSSAGGR